MERWVSIKGYEGYYEISDKGRVKSLSRKRITGGILSERILTPRFDKNGYVQFILYKDGVKKSFKGHHLVWEHFGNGERNGRIINIDHIDEKKANNEITNLQLLTNRSNLSKGKHKQNGSSQFTGVYKPKQIEGYQAFITINKKHKYLGRFKTEQEASEAYQDALKKLS
jgi:hypothetical protein